MEIVALLIIIALLWTTIGKFFIQGLSGDTPATANATGQPAMHWPARGDFDFDIVGESSYQEALKLAAGDHGDRNDGIACTALLVPEDQNPYDNKAVRVDINNRTVGYLSRENARSYRRRLAGKKIGMAVTSCDALIVGGYILGTGERAMYGVKLDIKPFW